MKKIVVVTGGSGAIGKQVSSDLTNKGYTVVFTYNGNKNKADLLLAELQSINKETFCQKVDVSDIKSVQIFADELKNRFGQIYGLVNCAGVSSSTDLLTDMPESVWYSIINTNLTGVFLMCKYLIPLMTYSNGGRIINISSIFANNPPSMRTAYAASKVGIIGLSKSLSKEVAHKQICVNTISPGPVDTEMLGHIWRTTADKIGVTFDEYKQNQLSKIPLAKLCKPIDVSNAIQFLLSDSSNHITGATLDINGGAV